jgi:hypothetical protein
MVETSIKCGAYPYAVDDCGSEVLLSLSQGQHLIWTPRRIKRINTRDRC